MLRAHVAGHQVRLVAVDGASDEIALGYLTAPGGGASVFAHGIVKVMTEVPPRDIPWFDSGPPPVFAAYEGHWLTLMDVDGEQQLRQVVLARENMSFERLAVGDQSRAVDLTCHGGLCAALTTRIARVATPGASLFSGAPETPASTWSRVDFASEEQGAQPHAILALDAASGKARVSMTTPTRAVLYSVRRGATIREADLPVHHGILDAAVTERSFLVASLGRPIDDKGCSEGGGAIAIESTAGEGQLIPTFAPPRNGFLRRLGDGAVFAWIAPVNCLNVERWIAHMVLLDGAGRPTGSPVAVGDATGFNLVTRGDELQLVISTPSDGIAWFRATCAVGPQPSKDADHAR